MRYKLLLPIMAFMLSCNFITGLGAGSTEGSVDYDAPADPLNVTVVLNETDSVSGLISPEGGELTFSSADGNTYTLEVPAGALDVETEIVMTTVQSIEDTVTGDGLFAVQLEPSGLEFNELVTLRILPAVETSIEEQIIFKYEGGGENVHLAVSNPFSEDIEVKLLDFSGIGYGAMSAFGTIFRLDADKMVTQNNPERARARLQEELGAASKKARKGKISKTEWNNTVQDILNKYKAEVVAPLIKAAKNDCKNLSKAENELKVLKAMRQGLLKDDNNSKDIQDLETQLNEIKSKCPPVGYCLWGFVTGHLYSNHQVIKENPKEGPFDLKAEDVGSGDDYFCTDVSTIVSFNNGNFRAEWTCTSDKGAVITQRNSGKYTINLTEYGNGTIKTEEKEYCLDLIAQGKKFTQCNPGVGGKINVLLLTEGMECR